MALFRYLRGHPEPCRGDWPAAPLVGFGVSFAVLILPASGASDVSIHRRSHMPFSERPTRRHLFLSGDQPSIAE